MNIERVLEPQVTVPAPERLDATDAELTAESAAAIHARSLDLLLLLTDRLPPASLTGFAKHGLAVFSLSDHVPVGEVADGFMDVTAGDGLVGIRLELRRGNSPHPRFVVDTVTNAHPYSAIRTAETAARHAVPLLRRMVSAIREGRVTDVEPQRSATAAQGTGRPTAARPLPTFLMLATLAARYASGAVRRRRPVDRWEIAYRWSGTVAGGHPPLGLEGYARLRPPPDRFWADPFPVLVGNRHYILFEELRYAEKRGYLRAVELGENGMTTDPVTVLERPYHMSYPFVFEYHDNLYMLPETCLEGRLELYRAVRAPYEWTLDRILLDNVFLIDATLACIDATWWLFACQYTPGLREWNDLVLFHADSPFGPWTPHRANPVISDARSARPAGALYRVGATWHRPAQDCSRTYGGALTIRRITHLTPTSYQEEEVLRFDPAGRGGVDGVHTANRLGNLALLDLKRR